jgi:hypothetical protein
MSVGGGCTVGCNFAYFPLDGLYPFFPDRYQANPLQVASQGMCGQGRPRREAYA